MYDFINAPHILIGGTTGSGKSVLLNGIILDIIRTQKDARFLLIDPKMLELYPYSKTIFCEDYVDKASDVPPLLDRAIAEIEFRNAVSRDKGVKTYVGNDIYIIIDELADILISEQGCLIKKKLQKILQIGRASRVHIIAATQAPSRRILPAELTLNFTDRIALRCVSDIESRQIVNVSGAETLPKHGKALYMSPNGLTRIDIPLVKDEEVKDVCERYAVNTPTISSAETVDYNTTHTMAMWKMFGWAICFVIAFVINPIFGFILLPFCIKNGSEHAQHIIPLDKSVEELNK